MGDIVLKIYKKCQSCAMPLKMAEERGTEINLEKSSMYCKHCYEGGEFTQKSITVDEMKQLVKTSVLKWGFQSF